MKDFRQSSIIRPCIQYRSSGKMCSLMLLCGLLVILVVVLQTDRREVRVKVGLPIPNFTFIMRNTRPLKTNIKNIKRPCNALHISGMHHKKLCPSKYHDSTSIIQFRPITMYSLKQMLNLNWKKKRIECH